MRWILSFLAYANLRWALAEYGRAEMLDRMAGESILRARKRVVLSDELGRRAGWQKRLLPLR